MSTTKRIAVFGAGGLGRNMARLLAQKSSMQLVAMCDRGGYAMNSSGLDVAQLDELPPSGSVADLLEVGRNHEDGIGELLKHHADFDGIFLALPNMPNESLPHVAERICESGFQGVVVDALKRTTAVEMMIALNGTMQAAGVLHITGAGATPGLLTSAAALAAQSFVEITDVEIRFGVGIANWDAYRATIREDIAHLAGFDVERVSSMSDAEIESELDRRNGVLELVNMEHADDVMLEHAGVVHRSRVRVGGVVDTRNPKKPVSTCVRVTGRTFEGRESTHVFTLGDETSMAANVNGPVLGFMNAGFDLRARGWTGLLTSADLMPKFPR